MNQIIEVTGMTCEACEYKIKHLFGGLDGVKEVKIEREKNKVEIFSEKLLPFFSFQELLKPFPKYQAKIFDSENILENELEKSWIETYKPLLLIAGFILGVSFLTSFQLNIYEIQHFNLKMFLHNFMTGFFLVFSFFKLLNLKEFAESFAMYDTLAMKMPLYGWIYPFIELKLGILCLIHFEPKIVYCADILIMGFGAIGVIMSVLNKRRIKCACLGSVFNLPMSTVTIIENLTMVGVGIFLLLLN